MTISFLRIVSAQPLVENGALVGLLAATSAELLSIRLIRCAEGVCCSVDSVEFVVVKLKWLKNMAFSHIF